MNLLGDGARWLAIGCALVAVVGGTAATSAVLRRRWLTIAKNAVVVVLSSLLAVAAVGLELNRINGWYPSSADLFPNNDPAPVTEMGARTSGQTFGQARVTRTDDRRLPALPGGTARLQSFTVATGHGDRWPVQVLLPQGYFDAANARRAYPVIVFAHGVPGRNQVWSGRMDLAKLLDPLVAQHRVQPFIAVMPEVTPAGLDTECIVGPHGNAETEDWLTREVPALVRSRLRVVPEREGWAIAGYSAGGWCASMTTILHPDVFGAGISLGGYFEPWWGRLKPTWPAGSPEARQLDLPATVRARRPRVALFVQTAKDDKESWPTTRRFLSRVKAPTLVAAQVAQHGGHTFGLWVPGLVKGVAWLGEQVPGFRP